MGKVTPFLWFDGDAEEAVNFYVSLIPNSRVLSIHRHGDQVPGMAGKVLTARFELDGRPFMAIDGGPMFRFTEAISMFVSCATQAEVDRLWDALTDGGEPGHCGWLKDRYGLSWQIIPDALGELMGDDDPQKAGAVMQAMLGMGKLDVAGLQRAYDRA